MTLGIEILRADYSTGAVVYRTAEGDTRANLTGIKLQVDELNEFVDRKLTVTPLPNDPDDPLLIDLLSGQDTFTLKGIISRDKTNNVDAAYIAYDLRYAVFNWASTGLIVLNWTDEESSEIITHSGYLRNLNLHYRAGNVGLFEFTFQFERGKIS